MHIAFAASECVPFAKTGGLADVVAALPPALVKLGHKVTVFLPRYKQTKLEKPRRVISSITVPFDDRYRFCSVIDGGEHNGVQFYFIDYPPFFDRDGLYGTPLGDYHDNAERFALFSRAALEASKVLGAPDLFHCHDWQTALIPVLLKTLYAEDPAFASTPSVFTIHNMGYQGIFAPEILPLLMLPWDLFTMTKLEFYGKVNFLKGAIAFSDFITTVRRFRRRSTALVWRACYVQGLEPSQVFLMAWIIASGILRPIRLSQRNIQPRTFVAKRCASRIC
jgi:starch synthase